MKEIIRVKTKKGLEDKIEDKKSEGYKLNSRTDRQAEFIKRNYGSALWHIVIFILTVWFTLGFGNLFYLGFNYFGRKDEVTIKIESKEGE